jgi:hypothetical protein
MKTILYLPPYGVSVVVGLIILLSLKEILSTLKLWNIDLNISLNIAILPLLIVFLGIVLYNILCIIQN